MIRVFAKLHEITDKILGWLAGILLGTMAASIFLQVIFRYILESPLAWSEELARFLFVWVTFLGGALAAIRGGHIAMSVLVDQFAPVVGRWVRGFAHLLTAFFFGVIAVLVFSMLPILMGQLSPALQLPMGYPYLGILIGSGLMCAFYLSSALIAIIRPVPVDETDGPDE